MQQITVERPPRLWPALLAITVVTAAAALGGRYLYQQHADTTVITSIVAGGPSGSATPSTPVPPPGSLLVQGSQDAVAHPQYEPVQKMTQDYFDAINGRDYSKFRGVITKARADLLPKAKFDHDFRSSADGSILIYRIDAAPDAKLRVLIGFTSTQDVADAPPELPVPCITWHVVWPLVRDGAKWRIDSGPELSSPQHDACAPA
ncbi:hypothetical protein [Actinocrispum wychmicini]|uniref:Uncharacterized protein n=1 Tax=Actinocrispum wychmicini TaxID=1213861 RepID=A0A4R2IU94_9PSEU|nr:hypothetical protein [Actinocrispum wychmicini]TCO47956.1 hypothetical protein EV192_1168 [Actinocrispum wychmicini]